MALDDHPANGKSQSHAVGFCRDECIEDICQPRGIDSRPAILDLDDNRAVAVAPRPQLQQAATVLESVHGLDGVADQIDENLLQLTAVAHDQRQFGLKLGPRRNIVNLQLLAERVEDANSQRIHIDRLVGLVGLAEQGANIVEHLAGAMGVG